MNQSLKNFQISQEKYSGPLDILLSLIEKKKMEITEVSLAKVTNDFLSFLGDIRQAQPNILADFLVVAAKLLLIKSRAIMPVIEINKEEDEEIEDFTRRLEIYQQFKKAGIHIKGLYLKNQFFSREFLANKIPIFHPPSDLKVEDLKKAFENIWEEFQSFEEKVEVEKVQKMVKIEERIGDILNILSKAKNLSFDRLKEKPPKKELIVNFLAILQMFKDQSIVIEQSDIFGEIQLELNEN